MGAYQEVEELGGMAKAITDGLPKMRIEEAAARTQARIDSGAQTVMGINAFPLDEPEQVDVRQVDNSAVLEAQIARLKQLRSERDSKAAETALHELTQAAERKEGNLLDLSVQAARARCTVGDK